MQAKGTIHWGDPGQSETAKWVTITPVMAQKYLDTCSVPFQRTVDQAWVDYLADAMKTKDFRNGGSVVFNYITGRPGNLLIDAYHRMRACVQSGVSFRAPVVYEEAADMDEVRKNYAVLNRIKTLTVRQVLDVYGLPDELSLGKDAIRLLGAAVVVIALRGGTDAAGRVKFPDHRRVALCREWAPEFQSLMGLWSGIPQSRSKVLRKAPIVAMALVTLRHQGRRAEEFWDHVGSGEMLKGDPEYTLYEYLNKVDRDKTKRVGPGVIARAVAAAWNAYYERRSLDRIQVTDDGKLRVLHLDGTPFPPEREKDAKPTCGNGPRGHVLAPNGRD